MITLYDIERAVLHRPYLSFLYVGMTAMVGYCLWMNYI